MNDKIRQHDVYAIDRRLVIDDSINKKFVTLCSKIIQIEKFKEIIVVRIHPQNAEFLNENIFGISYDGKILWQVEKVEHMDEDSPFTGMEKEGGSFFAYNWDGFDYQIDLKTGKIISRKYVK